MKKRNRHSMRIEKRKVCSQQVQMIEKVGRLVDDGYTMSQIQNLLGWERAQSSLYHYSSIYQLLKRAEPLVSKRSFKVLADSGLRFVHSVACLTALDDSMFKEVVEYLTDPANGCDITMLPRDRLTGYVLQTVHNWPPKNHLQELLHHKLRDIVGATYLWKNGIPSCSEVMLAHSNKRFCPANLRHGLRCDLLGVDPEGRFHMIEVKTSLNDLKSGLDRIDEYRQYADHFSILTSDIEVRNTVMQTLAPEIGVIFYDQVSECILPECSREAALVDIALSQEERMVLLHRLCRKFYMDKNVS
ncbi:MAG: MmcB family DNA repair protein [Oscillospiraceae bacterium]|nr:MmcB family DNA repair protein [Oscillospiraceae bacterium]